MLVCGCTHYLATFEFPCSLPELTPFDHFDARLSTNRGDQIIHHRVVHPSHNQCDRSPDRAQTSCGHFPIPKVTGDQNNTSATAAGRIQMLNSVPGDRWNTFVEPHRF
jgi:hypothetical protein